MGLIVEKKVNTFDTTSISKGCLAYIKELSSGKALTGTVTRVSETEIEMMFIAESTNVTNRITIAAKDIESYMIRWTSDLETINSYPEVEMP